MAKPVLVVNQTEYKPLSKAKALACSDHSYITNKRRGGEHIVLTFFQAGVPVFAAVKDGGWCFFVTAMRDGDGVRWMYSTTIITEKLLGIDGLADKEKSALAEKIITDCLA
ncbi:SH3 domain-containing protein [Photobacterium leiognathi]|uniref:hypothetical protein n=1 Tax=Photobacterium leiognathi TaxID=553611 RepID=UPI002980CFEA|nr:hypothetical protein [Photobacterium leiognathi]